MTGLPGDERRQDIGSRGRIVALEERYQKVATHLTQAVAIIGVTLFVVSAVCVVLIRANAARSKEARALADQIQQERARNMRDGCVAINQRHDDSITKLRVILEQTVAAGRSRERAEQGFKSTVFLIDALVPKRDCERLVREQVGKSPSS